MSIQIHILQDRWCFKDIEFKYKNLLTEFERYQLGVKEGRSSIHFCGMISIPDGSSYIFLPRKSYSDSFEKNLETARLTMNVLAQYSNEVIGRKGVSIGEEYGIGKLALISKLVKDFLQYGLFSERLRYRSKNSGKPDWPRTTYRKIPLINDDGSVVYPEIYTSRIRNSQDVLLSKIQAAVLLEIIEQHGWWIYGLGKYKAELKRHYRPNVPRKSWANYLVSILPNLYLSRTVSLTKNLISYLVHDFRASDGKMLFGVEDFHHIWEHMLRKVLFGVETGWNSLLPRPAYLDKDESYYTQERGLQPDIILRDTLGNIQIVDAKYYDATTINNAPGLYDIIKQFFYDLAVSSVVSNEKVKGVFVFPSNTVDEQIFKSVVMQHRDGIVDSLFPTIDCCYIDIIKVMEFYYNKTKMALPVS